MTEVWNTLTNSLGKDLANKVVQFFGGIKIYVPKNYIPNHRLEKLGKEDFKLIIKELGGCEIRVPKLHKQEIESKHRNIVADRLAGRKITELMSKYDLSKSQVLKILRNARKYRCTIVTRQAS